MEREWKREREREREIALRERLAAEEEELRATTAWAREHAAAAPRLAAPAADLPRDRSRSDTPATGSGSRPSSGQSYERERARPYAPRVANLLVHDADYYDAREDRMPGATSNTRGYPPEGPAASDSRKRSHRELEMEDSVRSPAHRDEPAAPSAETSRDVYPKRVHGDADDATLRRVSSVRDEHMDLDA